MTQFPRSHRSHTRLVNTYPSICGTSRNSEKWRRIAVFGWGTKTGKQKSRQVPDPHISSYSARIRMYVPPLESCESEESSCNVYGRIGDYFYVAKIEKIVKECIYDRILCSGTQNQSWEAGWISDKFPTYNSTQICIQYVSTTLVELVLGIFP